MADIYFKCRCGKALVVDETGAGRMVTCPDCGSHFMIPGPAIQWPCSSCGASLLALEEMRGERVQCMACQSEIRVPELSEPKPLTLKKFSAEPEARPSEALSAPVNKLFKDCPQCRERVPVQTGECPHCGHGFSHRAFRGIITGALCGVILVGMLMGLWQGGVWPFRSERETASEPLLPQVKAVDPPSVLKKDMPLPVPTSSALGGSASGGNTETVQAEIPAPAAVPVPTNAVSREAWKARVEASRQWVAAQMDRAFPRYAVNQKVALRQLDGLVVHGTNTGVGVTNVTLGVAGKPVAIGFQDLDVYDRLKVDEKFRATWIDAQAAALCRQSLKQEGMLLPDLTPSADEDARDQAMTLGDPQAQYAMAQYYSKQKDYPYALLYFQAAAVQNHAPAQYALGIMCYQGIGAGADRKEGLKWLILAAAQGHAKAEQFIQQHKLSPETRQKLLQQEQARKERELQDHDAALKACRNQETP